MWLSDEFSIAKPLKEKMISFAAPPPEREPDIVQKKDWNHSWVYGIPKI